MQTIRVSKKLEIGKKKNRNFLMHLKSIIEDKKESIAFK